jgi:hypothetical protein
MANDDLDAFISQGATPAPEPPAPAPAAPPAEAAPAPQAEEKPAVAAPAPDDDADPPEPVEGEELVPRRAFDAVRHQRHDWKAKAITAETRMAELERQLNEAKAAIAAPPPQPQQPVIQQPQVSFQEDPEGYLAQMRADQQRALMHLNANHSEARLRDKIGPEKVEEMRAEFKQMAAADPTLYARLEQQADPYAWAHAEVERMRLLRDMGPDPAAYRAKLIAEERAKWEAEYLSTAPQPRPVSPAAGMAPSLATARSVAGRSAPAYTGPTPLDALFGR